MNRKSLLMAIGSVAALAGALPTTVLAQDAGPTAIDEVVVTARKREESLQSVPIAVTAYNGQQIARQGVRTLLDLGRTVPSLRTSSQTSGASLVQFSLRGQAATDGLTTTDQAVGVYLDGVYIARLRGLNSAFFDVERVEVLKGPQGTLYGRNTTGGAINIITRGADHQGLHGYVSGDVGNYDMWAVRGAVNVPLVEDKLSVRLAYQLLRRDGFGHSQVTGQNIGQDRNQQIFRASVRFDPTPDFSMRLKVERYRSRENGLLTTLRYVNPTGAAVSQAAVELFGSSNAANNAAALAFLQNLAVQGSADYYKTDIGVEQRDDNDIATYGLTTTWAPAENIQLKSITAYRTIKTFDVFDLDATRFHVSEVGIGNNGGIPLSAALSGSFGYDLPREVDNSFFSQEFNVSGTAIDGRLNWLGGVFYSNESGSDDQIAWVVPSLRPFVFNNEAEKVTNRSWSLYSQNDFKLSDKFSITLGGRYTEERKGLVSRLRNFSPSTGLNQCTSGVTAPGGAPLFTTNPNDCRTRQEVTFSGYSYLASLNWQIDPDRLLYIRTAKGFRGGSLQLRQPTLPAAGPETATDYEIGLKSEWLNRRLRANFAAYRTEYANKQESTIITTPTGASATIVLNAASATFHGFEAEVVARLIEGLTLSANASYFHGKYGAFPRALPTQGGAPVDASGERFSNPPWQYSLSARYEFAVGPGGLGLQADWSWQAGARPPPRLIDPILPLSYVNNIVAGQNSGVYTNGRASLGLLNLRVDYNMPDIGVRVSAFATNALDKKYQFTGVSQSNLGGLQYGITGEPRMVGLSVQKNFGSE